MLVIADNSLGKKSQPVNATDQTQFILVIENVNYTGSITNTITCYCNSKKTIWINCN